MGQKVDSRAFRVGVYKDWMSRWFARKSYGDQLLLDLKIREYINKKLTRAEISHIEIERAGENVRIIIHTARPGVVIGKKGQEIEELKKVLAKKFKLNFEISVQEVKEPQLDAVIVAKNIAEQIKRRVSFKQAMRRAAQSTMRSGAKGIKIRVAGRLGGAEIARAEWVRIGSTPLHTLRVDIDYGLAEADTTYGKIGIKVWISKGEFNNI